MNEAPTMNRIYSLIIALAAVLASSAGYAQSPPIGYVKTHAGTASVTSGTVTLEALPGLALRLGDTVRTGLDGRVGLTLLDNTVMSLGPNAELVLDEYVFRPGDSQLGLGVRLLRGTLQFISGAIAKLRPEAVKVRTLTGTIGVRGTRFVVRAED